MRAPALISDATLETNKQPGRAVPSPTTMGPPAMGAKPAQSAKPAWFRPEDMVHLAESDGLGAGAPDDIEEQLAAQLLVRCEIGMGGTQ